MFIHGNFDLKKAPNTIVSSFDTVYDEEIESVCYDINDRKLICGRWGVKHEWVNAGIGWSKCERGHSYSAYIEERGGTGGLSGNVRLCRKCKIIDCFHQWDLETTYEVPYDKYYSETKDVDHCRRCNRNIVVRGGGECRPSERAGALIAEVMEERWKAKEKEREEARVKWETLHGYTYHYGYTGFGTTLMPNYGHSSGFYVELPVIVSRMLDHKPESEVREYIKECCQDGIRRFNGDLQPYPTR